MWAFGFTYELLSSHCLLHIRERVREVSLPESGWVSPMIEEAGYGNKWSVATIAAATIGVEAVWWCVQWGFFSWKPPNWETEFSAQEIHLEICELRLLPAETQTASPLISFLKAGNGHGSWSQLQHKNYVLQNNVHLPRHNGNTGNTSMQMTTAQECNTLQAARSIVKLVVEQHR